MSSDETPTAVEATWSASFVRTRTEMTIVAVTILAITHLDMTMTKIPGFGIELAHNAPRAVILAFLVCFYAYFTLSFYLKYRVEHDSVALNAEVLQRLNKLLQNRVEFLSTFQLTPFSDNILQHFEELNRNLEDFKAKTFGTVTNLAEYFKERWKPSMHSTRPTVVEDVVPKAGTLMDENSYQTLIDYLNHEINEAKRKNDKLYEQQVVQLNRDAVAHLGDVTAKISTLEGTLKSRIDHFLGELAAQTNASKADLRIIRSEITTLRREARNLARALTWDKVWLGFRMPLIFSFACVLFAAPQALYDMAPIIKAVEKCDPISLACFLREPATVPVADRFEVPPHLISEGRN